MTDAAPFELYHNQMSTCSAKVRLVLAEKAVPGPAASWTCDVATTCGRST